MESENEKALDDESKVSAALVNKFTQKQLDFVMKFSKKNKFRLEKNKYWKKLSMQQL